MSSLVPNPMIAEATLHNRLPTVARPYVWPFIALYPAFAYVYFERYEEYINGSEWTFVFLGTIVSLQGLLWLMPFWNVEINKTFTTKKANTVDEASFIRLIPVSNNGSPEIVPIQKINTDDHQEISFLFQKRRFIFDETTGTFAPPKFLIDEVVTLGSWQTATGLDGDIDQHIRLYGENKFDIPVPTFAELFKDHAVAPFFVFQMFCVGLWFMDEKWYYSLFTLFMLVAFESTVVWQRQRTMVEFRGMGVQPYGINVFRQGKWTEIQTDALLPGDLVSIVRSKEESGLPCDLLLINGTAILNEAMLSGESTPLLKESIQLRPSKDLLDIDGLDKNAVLYGGTKVLQASHSENPHVPAPPDNGALAIVTRTGFETSQGSLVRTMIFSTERVGAGNKEAYFFILFLLVFAIAASWYVWTEGVKLDRKRSTLLLDCIIIVTSVVPPELPMELTMAVNTSLAALSKNYIYCTEPFRIPFGGRIDICCFDKTGTLTSEDLVVEGVAGLSSDISALTPIDKIPEQSTLVLAAAHALVLLDDGEVVGDSMEQTTLSGIGWKVEKNDHVHAKNGKSKLRILRRFQFSSALKRSSSIANVGGKTLVAVKGAPETLRKMIVDVPAEYEETFKGFTRAGSRVLAFGYKYLENNISSGKVTSLQREEVESDLIFAGFLVFHCPLKSDAVETCKMLSESSHRVVMITGDNPLTACHVAKECEIVDHEVLILDAPEEGHGNHELVWRSVDEKIIIPVKPEDPLNINVYDNHDLCVTGYALAKLVKNDNLIDLLRHTWVYARVSPAQKEFILNALKEAGYTTLMCGDGTNDVGALKQAHVGVALLNGTENSLKKIAENARFTTMKNMYDKQVDFMKKWNPNGQQMPVPLPIAHLYPPGPANPNYLKAIEQRGGQVDEHTKAEIAKAQQTAAADTNIQAQNKAAGLADKLTAMMEENEEDAPTLKLGDASVAAPFTSKLANVSAITNIVRQGRCTLVATIQMYKILALNCLISAYSLSVLYLAGIKFGDGQATISGMLISVCFLSISRSKAIEKLSKERPQPGIFNIYIMGSILGQFAVHIATLVYVTNRVYALEPRASDIDLEAEFEPSLLNTAIYLLQLAQQVSTFAVNYQGRPFRESIRENRGMYYGLLGVGALAIAGSTEFVPELNEQLKLVPMNDTFKMQLTIAMILDLVVAWGIELVLKHYFSDYKASDIALHRSERETLVQKKNK